MDRLKLETNVDAAKCVQLVKELSEVSVSWKPFDTHICAFISDLAKALRRDRSLISNPAIAALAYWIRPANIERMKTDFQKIGYANARRVSRGVAFHVPPTNVDTLFVYSWVLSALCGNANVVRISPRAIEQSQALLDVVFKTLAKHPEISASAQFISYGRDAEITKALSDADIRIIWGGDNAVRSIRSVPAATYTKDLAFPDRFSLSALGAQALCEASDDEVAELAANFYNDAYWFDQLGCSSPRALIWSAKNKDQIKVGQKRFFDALSREIKKQQPLTATSTVMAKFVDVADSAASGVVNAVDLRSNDLTLAELETDSELRRDSTGGGLFYQYYVENLSEIVEKITRKEQTLSIWGISANEVETFLETLGSRGIDRIVNVGTALSFDRLWDGVDLLVEFTRLIHLPTDLDLS